MRKVKKKYFIKFAVKKFVFKFNPFKKISSLTIGLGLG